MSGLFKPNSIEARDAAVHLHSYTNALTHLENGPLVIERGDGIHVFDNEGRRYMEAMSGLWSVAVGFSEQRLVDAAMRQMQVLPFYHTFSHKSHGPVINLAEKLIDMAPVPMSKVYFTNSGSEANDTVIKLLWYRANAMGEPQRKKIISRKRGYHGVTVASASLTGLTGNHQSFDLPLTGILHVSCPHFWREAQVGESEAAFVKRLADELEETVLREGPETIAAFIGEPLMGAGGVVVPPAGYWAAIQAVLKKYDILLIADEVICGFGRTGEMFGSVTFGITPDVMVLSKQLSSSYLPISAVLINERIFAPIAEESNRIGVLGHGYTASGHPVAAAVALENIRIIEEDNLVENARITGAHLQARLRGLLDHPVVGEVRGCGMIAAVELVADKATRAPWTRPGRLGLATNRHLQDLGVIARNMVDAIAFCPPLIAQISDIDTLVDRMGLALDLTLADIRAAR